LAGGQKEEQASEDGAARLQSSPADEHFATSHGGSVIKSDILIRDSYNKTSSKQILPSLTIFQETNPWIISKLHLNVEFIFGSKSNYVLYS